MNGEIPRTEDGRALTTQEQLLLVVDQHTVFGERYWVPPGSRRSTIVVQDVHYTIPIGGAGDRSSLNALVRKGHIENVYTNGGTIHMGYIVTEAGRQRAQSIA